MPTTLTGAIPHGAMKDDEYMGYKIPKGAGLINNVCDHTFGHHLISDTFRFGRSTTTPEEPNFLENLTRLDTILN